MTVRRPSYALSCFALVLYFLVSLSTGSQAAEKITLKLQWLDQFQFGGYYMALEKGYYQRAGLQVDIVPYTHGNQDVVAEVLSRPGVYGTGRSSLVVDRVMGKPVVILSAIFQDAPSVLLTRNDTGINSVSDLVGRKIMISSDALAAAEYLGMFAQQGVRQHDIIHQKHSYNLNDLIEKKTDAMACYVSNEPYILKERGIGFNAFHPKDFGQNYYGDLLFTSEEETQEFPERARAFREATLLGWEYAFDNIEETARLIKAKYNGQNKSLQSLIFEGEALKKISLKKGVPLGDVNMKKLKEAAQAYYELGIFSEKFSLKGILFPN
jgi:polar amino acid transport system substrate-binding protein